MDFEDFLVEMSFRKTQKEKNYPWALLGGRRDPQRSSQVHCMDGLVDQVGTVGATLFQSDCAKEKFKPDISSHGSPDFED